MKMNPFSKRRGISVLELLAIATILGILAAIIVPRITVSSDTANQKENVHNKAVINAKVERWYVEKGSWPDDNLRNIGADPEYFPNGVPTNPIDGNKYLLDPTTHRVR